jgi:hypothetical protein
MFVERFLSNAARRALPSRRRRFDFALHVIRGDVLSTPYKANPKRDPSGVGADAGQTPKPAAKPSKKKGG